MPRKASIAKKNAVLAADVAGLPIPICNGGTVTSIAPNQTVCAQGAPSDAVFYLHTGIVKASFLSEAGKQAVFMIIGPESFFGESCLIRDARRAATVVSMTQCTIERIEVVTISRVLREDPNFCKSFLDHMVRRNQELLAELSNQYFHSTEKRLARALLRLASIDRHGEVASLRISQEILAEMIGTTRSRVSFFMNKFRRLGLIEYDRHGHMDVHKSLLDIF